jgi:uncharacterized protein (TIGR03545 family)
MAVQIFRWRAIGPLLLVLAVVAVLVWLFAEPVARQTTEEASTELLGTQVDVGKLDIYARQGAVELRRLQIADPFDPRRNLVEAADIRLKLDPVALAEKKLVVERFTLTGMRFGTRRERPARPVRGDGFAPTLLRSVRQWAQQFDAPLLSLTPIDTIRQLVLNPTQLATVREARALVARTDSTRQALEQGFRALNIEQTVDSARALVQRLAATDPKALGADGVRRTIETVRRAQQELEAAERRVDGLRGGVESGVGLLRQGVESLDEARRGDYAFARGLLKLPSLNAPEIGRAFFGDVSIDRFQQAVYWAELARHYMPPGLLPRQDPGPQRLRASGTTVRFPKEREYPSFLLREGRIDFAIGGAGLAQGAYEATVRGVTSEPALYGRPTLVTARRTARGTALGGVAVDAVIDHVRPGIRDSVSARLTDLRLPAFDLPRLPFRLDPGRGNSSLVFALTGDRVRARWSVASDRVSWSADTAGRRQDDLERLVWRVVSGLSALRVNAELDGPLRRPRLSVASNLDEAVARRLEAILGEEVARAEKLARAKVDSLVADKVEPVKRQVAAVQQQATERVEAARQQLDGLQRDLQAQADRLAGPFRGLIELPKIRL